MGTALSQCEDANITLYAILWSYGASTVDKERRVTINTPATRKALDYVKNLYESSMTNEVLSWDDASNNQAFLGGTYSWVHNAVSIYNIAKDKVPEIFTVTNHTLTPAGPGGQHGTAIPLNYGIWKFAQEKALAKEFMQFIMDPKTAMLKDYAKTAHMIGWPAPADRRAEQARAEWIVPNMFTFYATGKKSLEDAVSWGEAELQRIYTQKA